MSSTAPIQGDQSLRDQFIKAETDATFGYMSITVNLKTNKFQVARYAAKPKPDQDDEDDQEEEAMKAMFETMIFECRPKAHRFFIIRDPTQNNAITANDDPESKEDDSSKMSLYILIHYAPDLSPVKQRMIYASSRPSLKAFLGPSSFSEDYHCSSTVQYLQWIISAFSQCIIPSDVIACYLLI